MRVLHEEDGLIVVDKPPGLPTSGRDLDDPACLQHRLIERYRRMVWAVHQLDGETSGVVLFVRRKALVQEWAERLGRASKTYLAVAHGLFERPREGVIDAPIGYDAERRRQRIDPAGKRAVSRYRVVRDNAGRAAPPASLVEVRIETGRTHQVRVHLAHLGHPLLGERRYRDAPCVLHPRHALHAARIELAPQDGGCTFSAPLPADLRALLDALGLADAPD